MKKVTRNKFSAGFKAKVALEALKEQKTITDLAIEYGVHPTQIQNWKKQFLENASAAFEVSKVSTIQAASQESLLYEQIGKLQMENDWLKKKMS